MGWQPIETAPKDATEIIVSDGKTVTTGGRYLNKWWEGNGDCSLLFEPTHWMPLPAPPSKPEG